MWDRKSARAFETFQTDHVSCLTKPEPEDPKIISVQKAGGNIVATCLVDDCTWTAFAERKSDINHYIGEHIYRHGIAKAE